jgi:hypothetical protein
LGELTKQVLETALAVESDEHLGYARHAAEVRKGGKSRNGRAPRRRVDVIISHDPSVGAGDAAGDNVTIRVPVSPPSGQMIQLRRCLTPP